MRKLLAWVVDSFFAPFYWAMARLEEIERLGDDHDAISGCCEWTKRTKEILEPPAAQDISSTGEASSGQGKSDKPIRRKAA